MTNRDLLLSLHANKATPAQRTAAQIKIKALERYSPGTTLLVKNANATTNTSITAATLSTSTYTVTGWQTGELVIQL